MSSGTLLHFINNKRTKKKKALGICLAMPHSNTPNAKHQAEQREEILKEIHTFLPYYPNF